MEVKAPESEQLLRPKVTLPRIQVAAWCALQSGDDTVSLFKQLVLPRPEIDACDTTGVSNTVNEGGQVG